MEKVPALNDKILKITEEIRVNHPELQKYMNEMPEIISDENNPEITAETLTSYYDSLVSLMEGYGDNQVKSEEGAITTGTENSYRDLWTKLNNIELSYSYAGEGSVPVIFLHGFPFDKSMWKVQLDSLKDSCCVISIDIRGFGKSIDNQTHLSIDLFAEDLVSFMTKLKIEKAIICGLSMGGFIALNAVNKFPERFEGLILCDTQCIGDTAEVMEKRKKNIEQISINGTSEFNEKFIKSVFHPDSLTTKTEIVDSLRDVVFANSQRTITAGLTALAERSETCSTLGAIGVPTLIICGREDEVTPLAQSEFMHENITGSILKIIDHAGHVSNLEQPDEFNAHLKEFLIAINVVKYVEPNSEPLNPRVETS